MVKDDKIKMKTNIMKKRRSRATSQSALDKYIQIKEHNVANSRMKNGIKISEKI